MKEKIKESCLYVFILSLLRLLCLAGIITLFVGLILATLGTTVSPALLWSGFGVWLGAKVINNMFVALIKILEEAEDNE